MDDVTSTGKHAANVWSGFTYELPRPYLRPRVVPKGEEKLKRHFVPAPGDGPEYKFPGGRKETHGMSAYGKDAKMPPASYLPLPVWGVKKEANKDAGKDGKGAAVNRNSFIDAIIFNGNKYKFPGPSHYFASAGKDADKKQDKPKEKEVAERRNFLMDYQYLGMNSPGPGEYPLRDSWAEVANRKKQSKADDSKKGKATESWKVKRDQGHGPGQYDIVRLMTVVESTESGGKQMKKFKSIPVLERAKLGVIHRGHVTKRSVDGIPASVSPATYFKKEGEIERAHLKTYRPMRRY